VLHGDLQRFYYNLGDMNTQYPNIEEDIEFTKVLIVKKNWRKTFQVWELNCIALFVPLKQILSDINKFFRFVNLYKKSWGTNALLGARSNSTLINF
jgi:hypothetical protein